MNRCLTLGLVTSLLAACSGNSPQCDSSGCACQSTSDCASGLTCIAGFCAAAQSCQANADCTGVGEVCDNGFCIAGTPDAGPAADAGHLDAGREDGGVADGGQDAGPRDGGIDAGPDGGPDAGFDAGSDGGGDAGIDAGLDAGADGGPTCTGSGCCTSDSQCDPPALICSAGKCVEGCLPGGCATGQRCDTVLTGRCQPPSGNGAVGTACTSFAECGTTNADSQTGFCLPLLLADGGVSSFCSSICEATSSGSNDCPPGYACASFGGGNACLPESDLGLTLGSGLIGASCSLGGSACDSVIGCGHYGSSGAAACSDTCQGPSPTDPSTEVCPGGWACDTELFYTSEEPDAGGAPITCSQDSTCTQVSSNALCFSTALGGDGHCHLVFREDACLASSGGSTNLTGAACSGSSVEAADAQCEHGFCLNGKCADPCCSSKDCPGGYACESVVEQLDSVVMACVSTTGDGGLGAPCTPGGNGACRAELSPSDTSDLCIPDDPYTSGTTGYCSDSCCDDSECGAGYYCTLYAVLTDGQGNPLFSNVCLKL